MKSLFPVAVVTALLVAGSTPVLAAESAAGGLGFRANTIHTPNATELRLDAPVGVRWWLGPQKVGVDLGVGYASHHDDLADKNTSDWSLDVGIPIALKSWERVRVIARPGINYTSQEDYVPGSTAGTTEKITDKFTNGHGRGRGRGVPAREREHVGERRDRLGELRPRRVGGEDHDRLHHVRPELHLGRFPRLLVGSEVAITRGPATCGQAPPSLTACARSSG